MNPQEVDKLGIPRSQAKEYEFPKEADIQLLQDYEEARKVWVGAGGNWDDDAVKDYLIQHVPLPKNIEDMVMSVGGKDSDPKNDIKGKVFELRAARQRLAATGSAAGVIQGLRTAGRFPSEADELETVRNDGFEIWEAARKIGVSRGLVDVPMGRDVNGFLVYDLDGVERKVVNVDLTGANPDHVSLVRNIENEAVSVRSAGPLSEQRLKDEQTALRPYVAEAVRLGRVDIAEAVRKRIVNLEGKNYGELDNKRVAGECQCGHCNVVMAATWDDCPRCEVQNVGVITNDELTAMLKLGQGGFGEDRLAVFEEAGGKDMRVLAKRINDAIKDYFNNGAELLDELKRLETQAARFYIGTGAAGLDFKETIDELTVASRKMKVATAPVGGAFLVKEITMTDEYWAKSGKYIGEFVEADSGTGNLEVAVKEVEMNLVKRVAKEFSGSLKDEDLEKIRVEVRARLELKQVSAFWATTKDFQGPKDQPIGLVEKLPSAPKLSKETYRWMMEQRGYWVMDSLGNPERVDLRGEIDVALKGIWEIMTEENPNTHLQTTIGTESNMLRFDEVKIRVLAGGNTRQEAFVLAWRLAEAEMWGTEMYKSGHPAARVINFAGYRYARSENAGVPGGRRVWFKYQEEHPGEVPIEAPISVPNPPPQTGTHFEMQLPQGMTVFDLDIREMGQNPYHREGRGFAGTGLFYVPGARDAIRNGRYLDRLEDEWNSNTEFSPQEKAMASLNAGSKMMLAMKDMGGGEAKYFSADKLGGLTPWIFMLDSEVVDVQSRSKGKWQEQIFEEWAKSLIWNFSLANPEVATNGQSIDQGLIATAKQTVDVFRAILEITDGGDVGKYVGRAGDVTQQRERVKAMIDWYKKDIADKVITAVRDNNPLLLIPKILGVHRSEFEALKRNPSFGMYHAGLLAGADPDPVYNARRLGQFGEAVGRKAKKILGGFNPLS